MIPRALRSVLLVLALSAVGSLALLPSGNSSGQQQTIAVDPYVWQFSEDYPGAEQNDAALPISRVLLKTHDGSDWMATYDDHVLAIDGPARLKQIVDMYDAQGVEVVAWFVPKGTNVQQQLTIAKQVIDTPGIKALYADVEPYAGFCTPNCEFLADNFWAELREDRPNARLGVIYDPRDPWAGLSHAGKWLKNADVALPMCYWESFFGQGAWAEPDGCLIQGYYRLLDMVGDKEIDYEPSLQGDASPARFTKALDAALNLGSERVTVWRRGTIKSETWDAIAGYTGDIDRPCWIEMPDGCLLREIGTDPVYVIAGGAKFHVPSPSALKDLGFTFSDVDPAPQGFIASVPDIPRDDSLIRELKQNDVYVVYGSGRFRVADAGIATAALNYNLELTQIVPPGGLEQVPTVPADYTRFREDSFQEQYVIVNGGRIHVNWDQIGQLNAAGHANRLYLLPNGSLDHIPVRQVEHGDVSCDGLIAATDALMMLQTLAGIPNPGICSTPDIDCDGANTATDALKLLRHIAGLGDPIPLACPAGEASAAPDEE